MLPKCLIDLLDVIKKGAPEDAHYASRRVGLLIERHAQGRYNESSYELLLDSDELFKLRLNEVMVDELIEELFSIFENQKDLRVMVGWPLGKTYRDDVIKRLLEYFGPNWNNDDLASVILMAVYDEKLLDGYWEVVERIANEGTGYSKELACEELKVR